MRRFLAGLTVAVVVALFPGPAQVYPAAQPAAAGLSVQSIDLRTNQPAAQAITVGEGLAEITVTVPSELLFIAVVRRDFDNCPKSGNVFTCSAGAGQLQVAYAGTAQTGAFADNQTFTVTAQSSGVTATGTVTIRRSADLALGDASYQEISASSVYLLVAIANHGPNAAVGVKVFVDGVDPRAFVGSNCSWSGARVLCPITDLAAATPGLAAVTMSRCVSGSPVTVSVAAATTDSTPGNNSKAVPPMSGAGDTCAVVFRNMVPPGGPPGGSGSGPGTGNGSGTGSGSASGATASPGATPEAGPTGGATSPAPATDLAGGAPSGSAPVVAGSSGSSRGVGWGGSAIVVAVLAGAGAGWWLRRRRLGTTPAVAAVTPDLPAADS